MENRDKYIANFCGHDLELKECIGNRVKETETINTMTFIPVFCWAVCSLFRDDKNIEAPKTHTALYAYLLLVFLRNHGGTKKKLVEMLKDPNIKICLDLLSKMAYLSLINGKIVFEKEDFEGWDIEDLEHIFHISGLITKIEGGDLDECSYQFTHRSLHEFLAATYIFYNYDGPIDFIELLNSNDYRFRYVVPYIAGLEGGRLNNSKSQKIVQLYSKLWDREERTFDFRSLSEWEWQGFEKYYDPEFSIIDDLLLLPEVLYEYQNELVEFSIDGFFVVKFSGSPYHDEAVLCFLHALFKWKKTWPIRELTFSSYVFSTKVSFEQLLMYMQKCPSVVIKNCCFQGNTWNKFSKAVTEIECVTVIESSSQIDMEEYLPLICSYITKAINKGNLKLRCFSLEIQDCNHKDLTVKKVELNLQTSLTLKYVNISVQIVKALLPIIIPCQKTLVFLNHCLFEEDVFKELCDLCHKFSQFFITSD